MGWLQCNLVQLLWQVIWQLNECLPYNPEVLFLVIFLRHMCESSLKAKHRSNHSNIVPNNPILKKKKALNYTMDK